MAWIALYTCANDDANHHCFYMTLIGLNIGEQDVVVIGIACLGFISKHGCTMITVSVVSTWLILLCV